MERLKERITDTEKALIAFREVMAIEYPTAIERDAAIQRFEFTFEAIWKTAREMLYVVEGIDIGSPKGVIRACREVNIFSDAETVAALKMVDDRNLTIHTYNESLAKQIYSRLSGYLVLMEKWFLLIKEKAEI